MNKRAYILLIILVSIFMILSTASATISREYEYWYDIISKITLSDPGTSYDVLELWDDNPQLQELYAFMYNQANVQISCEDHSISLNGYNQSNKLFSATWYFDYEKFYQYGYNLIQEAYRLNNVYSDDLTFSCVFGDDVIIMKDGQSWYCDVGNDLVSNNDPADYFKSCMICNTCGSIKETPNHCWNCDRTSVAPSLSFLLLNEITWATDAATLDTVLLKNGFTHGSMHDYWLDKPMEMDGVNCISYTYNGKLIYNTTCTNLGAAYDMDGKLHSVWIQYGSDSRFDSALSSVEEQYGRDYSVYHRVWEEDEDDEAYVWKIDDGYVVLLCNDGKMENAKIHQANFCLYFYEELPEEYVFAGEKE